MRALVQRVSRAAVRVDDRVVGEIGPGLLVLLGVAHEDDEAAADRLAEKVRALRIFADADGHMNEPLGERELLCVSQFTLYGETRRGNRPSFIAAAAPEQAERLYKRFCERAGAHERGVFGAHMQVELVNDGPVTLLVEVHAGGRTIRTTSRATSDALPMAGASITTERGDPTSARHDRLLPWIAAERAFRTVVLLAVGIVLVTHPHANWASEVSRLAQHVGLDPKDNWIQRIIDKVKKIHAHEDVVFGVAALAYGALEGTEAYGLFRRRAWGEWLTVVATSLLFIPEVWELTKSVSLLKFGALAANALVVAYLVWRLRRRRAP